MSTSLDGVQLQQRIQESTDQPQTQARRRKPQKIETVSENSRDNEGTPKVGDKSDEDESTISDDDDNDYARNESMTQNWDWMKRRRETIGDENDDESDDDEGDSKKGGIEKQANCGRQLELASVDEPIFLNNWAVGFPRLGYVMELLLSYAFGH